ncbi:MAG: hypothetical protein PHV78_03645 [Patescibacteria group bacterium]|nr:hypothetical protein [Patescibacteria group bacterium]MDD5121519.1 hypothetical protein [Patescibacteria group bacterium]MDD5221849.1 hypothetical protein [Patescibacteria group bacterium]MDD5396318.1 hypothetical protein [Patescibacteria group bacterium]
MIINNKSKLKKIISRYQSRGQKVLIKKGVFDIVHPGYLYLIKMLRKRAEVIIILTQSDKLTKFKKGSSRPINNQKDRTLVIDSIKGVDYTFADKSNSKAESVALLRFLKPDYVAMTVDEAKSPKEYGRGPWKLLKFSEIKKSTYSTTRLIDKISNKYH